jgi:hypothetical protein
MTKQGGGGEGKKVEERETRNGEEVCDGKEEAKNCFKIRKR